MFYRLNKDGLAELLKIEKNPESIYNMGEEGYKPDNHSEHTNQTAKTIQTTIKDQVIKIEVSDKTDFMLVDLRAESDFEKFHILEGTLHSPAINFPTMLIARDRFPQQMHLLVVCASRRKTSRTS